MLRDAAVTLILNRVGQRGGSGSPTDTVLQTQAITELQFAQEQLERGEIGFLPWFLESEYTGSFATVASTATVALPTGFLREQEEQRIALFYQDTTKSDQWVPIEKVDYDEGKTSLGGDSNGKPQAYSLMGLNYRLWPTPDAIYNLKALIYLGDALLTSNIENNWLKYAGELIIGKAGIAVAGFGVRDDKAMEYFTQMYAAGRDALLRQNTVIKEGGRGRQQGED